jgi:hypothetical protein
MALREKPLILDPLNTCILVHGVFVYFVSVNCSNDKFVCTLAFVFKDALVLLKHVIVHFLFIYNRCYLGFDSIPGFNVNR